MDLTLLHREGQVDCNQISDRHRFCNTDQMAFSTSISNKLFVLLISSVFVVFGFESEARYGNDVNENPNNIKLNLDILFGGHQNDELSTSRCNSFVEQYCISKVGINRFEFPCRKILEQKHKDLPRNCQEVKSRGNTTSGLYEVQPDKNRNSFMVLCDMEIKGGGWTHIHKRFDGSVDFNRTWREYKFGFGDLNEEFWIGLENMHLLTGTYRNELLVELVDRENGFAYARYDDFRIGSESDGYPLEHLSGYSGDAGDSLKYHLGMKFTTKDVDQDNYDDHSCADFASGAYWYNNCFSSNLNGELINHEVRPSRERQGMSWDSYKSRSYVLAKARMLIRPFSYL